MTGEVNGKFNERSLFYLEKKSNLLHYKIYNSFSQKIENFCHSGFTCFTDPLTDGVKCGSLGPKSMLNVTDRWLRTVSCCTDNWNNVHVNQ